MGKIRNLCMTQLVRMKKIKEPDMYTWIFSSVDNCYYNYNSRYLFEYVKEHLPQITPIFVINEEGLRRELSKKYGEQYFIETESKEGIRLSTGGRCMVLPQQDSRYMDRGLEGIV